MSGKGEKTKGRRELTRTPGFMGGTRRKEREDKRKKRE
jgi:hypothetical protein